MRMRMPFLTGVLCLAYATPAFACDFYFNSTFLRIPARPAFGGGMQTAFGDATIWSFAGDVAMRLGDKAVVQPGLGVCTGGDNTDWFFGAGGAYRIMQSASMTINFQTGLTYASISGGSQLKIPFGGSVLMRQNETMALYGGASFVWSQVDFEEFDSVSDIDPLVFGGLQMTSGPMVWSFGGQLLFADDIELGILAGGSMNTGIHGGALRFLKSLIRK